MSHKTHKKLGSPFSNRRTLKPSGMPSTCTSHEYSSVAESRASPVFWQLGHVRFSTQLSRAIRKYAPQSRNVPYVAKAPQNKREPTRTLGNYFGGCSSPFNQPVALSVFRGSGPSQSKHWNVRGPLPGGSARIEKAPQPGQVGRSAWPMIEIYD